MAKKAAKGAVVLWPIPVTKEEKAEIYAFVASLPPPKHGGRNKPAPWARELILATVRKSKKGA